MRKVKITVLKTTFQEDLVKEYGVDGLSTCPLMEEGQIFYADISRPDGFCDGAWNAIYPYVFAMAQGRGDLFDGDWIKTPGVAIVSCNDGLRPVIMKLESEESESYDE